MTAKKPSLMQRLFGSKKLQSFEAEEEDDVAALQAFQTLSFSRRHTVDVETFRSDMSDEALMSAASAKFRSGALEDGSGQAGRPIVRASSDTANEKPLAVLATVRRSVDAGPSRRTAVTTATKSAAPPTGRPPPHHQQQQLQQQGNNVGHHHHHHHHQTQTQNQNRQRRTGAVAMTPDVKPMASTVPPAASAPARGRQLGTLIGDDRPPNSPGPFSRGGGSFKRRVSRRERKRTSKIDTSQPLVFPTTPETILEHHKAHPFLDENEEWLLVELNEYECLVDSPEIIRIIAKHSKFFEVEPDELWEEFFEFVDDVPSYDEVINFDVWQEFRDKKYTR